MKELLKKIFNVFIDVIFYIPKLLIKILKYFYLMVMNADSILQICLRIFLLLVIILAVIFIFIGKEYNLVRKGFYFEKYNHAQKALTKLFEMYPKNKTNLKAYVSVFEKAGAECKNRRGKNNTYYYNCRYTQNVIYAKQNWTVNINYTSANDVNSITIAKVSEKSAAIEFLSKSKDIYKDAKTKTEKIIEKNTK